jgi:pyruvyltransferase
LLKRKFIKLIRQARWSPPVSGGIPLHWHVGRPNFGDDLNPYLFSKLANRGVQLCRNSNKKRFLGMGSILARTDARCKVLGSGLLDPKSPPTAAPISVVSLRGQSSADATGWKPAMLGDPAVLCETMFPQSRQTIHPFGFVPHHSEVEAARRATPRNWLLIDPCMHPLRLIKALCTCERILSRSLHGLILADAYRVPNSWLAPTDEMHGGKFKFGDYYTTTCEPKEPTNLALNCLSTEAKHADYYVSPYRYSLTDYRAVLQEQLKDYQEGSS